MKINILFVCLLFPINIHSMVNVIKNENCDIKKAVLILGAPRSGTSATTGLLKILGLNLGENLSDPQSWNPKGDFEDKSTIILNKEILQKLSISPYESLSEKIDWDNTKALECKNMIKDNLQRNFGYLSMFGLKHPRICLLLPLYLKAIEELNYIPKLVIVLRDPIEIIASLNASSKQKEFVHKDKGIIFINNFIKPIWSYSKNYEKVIVTLDEVLGDTLATVEKIRMILPELKKYDVVKRDISNFLEKGLKHQVNEQEKKICSLDSYMMDNLQS